PIADHHFDRVSKESMAFDVATKVQPALLQHLEDFLGQIASLHIFVADRHQTDRRILVAEDMSRIDGAHDGVLQHVFRTWVAIGSGIDQNKDVGFRWDDGGYAGPINAWQRS